MSPAALSLTTPGAIRQQDETMRKRIKIIIPVVIFGLLLSVAAGISSNPPAAPPRSAPPEPSVAVATVPLMPRDYRIELESYGAVRPRTQTTLTAQVEGQIVFVNPNIRDGGFFDRGDVLVSIDPRDYEANVQIAEAGLMDARQALADAIARSDQAREDWEMLGKTGEPPALVLRLPQLEAARAGVISAEAVLRKARLNLERTRIVAPFAGRVLEQLADVGQVVSSNSDIAIIYATDYIEVRLPIRNRDLAFVDLPVMYRDSETSPSGIPVEIVSDLVGHSVWDAHLVRTEGAIDQSARQLHVIAQIDDPFSSRMRGQPPLKIGQYVTARLPGRVLRDALVVPNSSIYQGSYVYVVEGETLQRRNVEIAWQNDRDAVIENGLTAGELLVTTPLGQVTSGVRVSMLQEEPPILATGSPSQSERPGESS
jgi:RND family efflux transporter MFP subunit